MHRISSLHDWDQLAATNPMLPYIAQEVVRRVPGAQTIVFYGSQVTGDTDPYSDYDVLIIAPSDDVPDLFERAEIEKALEERHGIKVQVVATSPSAAWLELRLKPYLRHWLEHGVILGNGSAFSEPLPPLAKLGAYDCLITIECDLEEMVEEGDGRRWKGEWLIRSLRRLLIVRAAIQGKFQTDVKREVEALVGPTTQRRVRNPKGRLSAEDVEKLQAAVDRLLKEVGEMADRMPENSSDEEIKREVALYQEGEPLHAKKSEERHRGDC